MAKKALPFNVHQAALARLEKVFTDFPRIYLSFSGGKDSTVLLHLAAAVARKHGRRFGVLLVDLEGQYRATLDHARASLAMYRDLIDPYWVCLPIALRNAVSVFAPKWLAWDPAQRERWVHTPPEFAITDSAFFPFFRPGMEFEEFVIDFGRWFAEGKLTACLVAIRADESLNRYRAITSERKSRFENLPWTTWKGGAVYNAYPIYDWRTEDVWVYHGKTGLPNNPLYDMMYLSGVPLHNMRICQPYGDDQRKGLDQFHKLEPETWARVVARVDGANYGALYAHTCGNILGNIKQTKPADMTWQDYTLFLLETLPPNSRAWFEDKFAVFLRWYELRGYPLGIPDEADPAEEAAKKTPSWRRLARCILKNDYWCKSLSFGMQKSDAYEKYSKIMKKRREIWRII